MKQILCPTDFSLAGTNATVFAAKLAKATSASLELFNVQLLSELTPEEVLMGEASNATAAQRAIEEACQEVRAVFKVSCSGSVVTSISSLTKEIDREASRFDLVVMGTNGEDSIAQFFFGSNSYRFSRKSRVPMIIVPENTPYRKIRHIVCAFDYWRGDQIALTQICAFARSVNAGLTILQVMEESFSRKAELEMKGDQAIIRDLYGDSIAINFRTLHNDNIKAGISDFVKKSDADILALCSQARKFLGNFFHRSVIKGITGDSAFPIYIFHR